MSLLRSVWWLFLSGAASMVLSACGAHVHLSDEYGRANEGWMREQRISSKAEPGSPLGLDSEESAMILKGYKKSIGGGGGEEAGSRVMLVQEGKDAPK